MIIHAMYMLTQKTTDRHQLTFEVFEYHLLLVLSNILWIEQYLSKVNYWLYTIEEFVISRLIASLFLLSIYILCSTERNSNISLKHLVTVDKRIHTNRQIEKKNVIIYLHSHVFVVIIICTFVYDLIWRNSTK